MTDEALKAIHVKLNKQFRKAPLGTSLDKRFELIDKLHEAITTDADDLITSLQLDLNKPSNEAKGEIIRCIDEIKYQRSYLKSMLSDTAVPVDPGKNYSLVAKGVYRMQHIEHRPRGVCLIINTWNFPVMLTMQSLIGAIAAGNRVVVVLPSVKSTPQTSNRLMQLYDKWLASSYSHVVCFTHGGRSNLTPLLKMRWDHVSFTGSPRMGKVVCKAAAKHLTPCLLELGGKSPCIVTNLGRDDKAQLQKHCVRQIVEDAFYNCGQMCTRVDYLLIDESYGTKLVTDMIAHMQKKYGGNALHSDKLGKVANRASFDRLCNILREDKANVITGGDHDVDTLRISPTLVNFCGDKGKFLASACMRDEIFGPILPVYFYKDLREVTEIVNHFPDPLAAYVFSSEFEIEGIKSQLRAGSITFNDTAVQGSSELPFGGVGNSGMGRYHKQYSFEEFTHQLPVCMNYFK